MDLGVRVQSPVVRAIGVVTVMMLVIGMVMTAMVVEMTVFILSDRYRFDQKLHFYSDADRDFETRRCFDRRYESKNSPIRQEHPFALADAWDFFNSSGTFPLDFALTGSIAVAGG